MTLPFHTATPRLTMPQHSLTAYSPGTFGSYFHNSLPVLASKAYTLLHGEVTKMRSSTTTGVVS